MPNQYTGGATEDQIENGGRSKKFSVRQTAEQDEHLLILSNYFRMSKSEIVLWLTEFAFKRMEEFAQANPDAVVPALHIVMAAYYSAGKQRMAVEWQKASRELTAYQEAKLADGGRVNYKADHLAMEFHMRAWSQGKSADELLKDFAAKVEALNVERGIDLADPTMQRRFAGIEQPPAEPPKPAEQPKPAEEDVPTWDEIFAPFKAWQVAVLLALAVGVLVALGVIGWLAWRWFMSR